MKKETGFEISADQRQSWVSIAFVWIGSLICVPALMVGGMLGSGLSLGKCLLSILIGYTIICVYMCLMGMQGCDTGLPTAVMATNALGEKGAIYILSTILAIACIGWFGIQAAVCGSAFSNMIGDLSGFHIPIWLSSILWGVIMVLTACFGFSGLKWLNKLAVPLLLIVCIYTLVYSINGNNGISTITSYVPVTSLTFVDGISMTVATFAVGGAIAGDYCRFAKSRSDVIKSSVIGVLPAGILMLMIGAILTIVTGSYDISVVLSSAGLPVIGLIALILATWTTNVSNAYSGGLSLSVLLGQNEQKSRLTTGIAGIVGTLLTAVGIMNSLQGFLSLLSALVPTLVGTLIADYWIVGKGNKDAFAPKPGFSAAGLISYITGALVACITGGTFASFPALAFLNHPFFIGPINGIVVSMVLYLVIHKLMPAAKAQ